MFCVSVPFLSERNFLIQQVPSMLSYLQKRKARGLGGGEPISPPPATTFYLQPTLNQGHMTCTSEVSSTPSVPPMTTSHFRLQTMFVDMHNESSVDSKCPTNDNFTFEITSFAKSGTLLVRLESTIRVAGVITFAKALTTCVRQCT